MIYAIKNNRVEFVKLFLENGFSLKNFVTARSLIKIYNELPEKDAFLRRYIFNSRTIDKGERLSFKLIGCAIESLLDNFYDHKFTSSSLSKLTHKELSQILKHTVSFFAFFVLFFHCSKNLKPIFYLRITTEK